MEYKNQVSSSNLGGKVKYSKQLQPTGTRKHNSPSKGKQQKSVDLTGLDTRKAMEEIENCLELLIITLCRSLSLRPKQVGG